MPYLSIAEKERQLWMTLPEAVAHVRSVERCELQEAQQQIRKALADGAILTRWEGNGPIEVLDDGGLKYKGPRSPPRADKMWLAIYLDWDSGAMVDAFELLLAWATVTDQSKDGSERSLAKLMDMFETVPISENPTTFSKKYGFTIKTDRLLLLRSNMRLLWPTPSAEPVGGSTRMKKTKRAADERRVKILEGAMGLIKASKTPITCGSWLHFCRVLRKEIGVGESTRNYGNDTIEKIVRPLLVEEK